MTWNVATPAGSDSVRNGDDVIRQFKQDVETALQSSGNFPIDANNPQYEYVPGKGDTASRPTNSEGGLYFDTDENALIRDNNVGWNRVAISFPSGTKAVFWQGTAPTGWTKDVSILNRFLVNDSSQGGTTGGSWAGTSSSDGAHVHGVAKYYVSGSNVGVTFYTDTFGGSNFFRFRRIFNDLASYSSGFINQSGASATSGTIANGENFNSSSEAAHTHDFTHTANEHAFKSVMIAEKD